MMTNLFTDMFYWNHVVVPVAGRWTGSRLAIQDHFTLR